MILHRVRDMNGNTIMINLEKVKYLRAVGEDGELTAVCFDRCTPQVDDSILVRGKIDDVADKFQRRVNSYNYRHRL